MNSTADQYFDLNICANSCHNYADNNNVIIVMEVKFELFVY